MAFSSSLVIFSDFAVCIISSIFCSTRRRLESRSNSRLPADTKVPMLTCNKPFLFQFLVNPANGQNADFQVIGKCTDRRKCITLH